MSSWKLPLCALPRRGAGGGLKTFTPRRLRLDQQWYRGRFVGSLEGQSNAVEGHLPDRRCYAGGEHPERVLSYLAARRGRDMAACDLEEFKSSYSSKTRNWQEMKAVTEEASQAQDAAVYKEVFDNIWNALKQDRKKFIALCMRARGWQLRSGQGERSTDCILDHFDQANCYEPATPAA